MPRAFVAGSSQFLNVGSGLVTAAPLTVHAWVRPTTATGLRTVFCLGTSSTNAFYLYLNASTVTVNTSNTTGTNATATPNSPILGRWLPVGGVWASATSRQAFADGRGGTVDATSKTPTGINDTTIGARKISAARDLYWTGDIADVALWNVALTSGEMLMLALGTNPLTVRPTALIAYWPLAGYGSSEYALGSNNPMTNTGTTLAMPRPTRASTTSVLYYPPPSATTDDGRLWGGRRRRMIIGAASAALTVGGHHGLV